MPPPVPPFDGGLRVSHGGRSATRGESKDELLARASAERATRLDARRRTHAALTVQRCWRGRRCASAALRELLREWDARFGDLRAPPPWDVARVALLPPVFLAGRALAGEQRCLRVCALALASVGAPDPDVSACSPASLDDPGWSRRARKLAAFALDVLEHRAAASERSGDDVRVALGECAARLFAAVHDARAWRVELMETEIDAEAYRERAEAIASGLMDPSTPDGAARLRRACETAAALCSNALGGKKDLAVAGVVAATAFRAAGFSDASSAAPNDSNAVIETRRKAAGAATLVASLFARAPGLLAALPRRVVAPLATPESVRVLVDAARDAFSIDDRDEDAAKSRVAARESPTRVRAIRRHAARNALDALLFLATGGWRAPAPGAKAKGAAAGDDDAKAADSGFDFRAARATLAATDAEHRAALAAAVAHLAGFISEHPDDDDDVDVNDAGFDNSGLESVACLEEVWFVMALVAEKDEKDADNAALDAAARLYWSLCSLGPNALRLLLGRGADPDPECSRRRVLGACAFCPRFLPRLWARLAASLPAARALPDAPRGGDGKKIAGADSGPGVWTSPAALDGAAGVADGLVAPLGAFCLALAHSLQVLSDEEFFEEGAKAAEGKKKSAADTLALDEHRAIAAFVNTLVVRDRLQAYGGARRGKKGSSNGGGGAGGGGSFSKRAASSDDERNESGKKQQRALLIAAGSALLGALRARDERRSFAPPGLWTAPAEHRSAGFAFDFAGRDGAGSDGACSPLRAAVAVAARIDEAAFADAKNKKPAAAASRGSDSRDSNDSPIDALASVLLDCPHALPFEYRVAVFRELVRHDRQSAGFRPQAGGADAGREEDLGQRVRPVAEITVRREMLLEDTLAQLLPLGDRLRGRVLVRYVNAAGEAEAGIDAGGLFKELVSDVVDLGLNPERGIFDSTAEDALVFPRAAAGDTHEGRLVLELVGAVVGKAMYEGVLLESARLAPFFAKTLLGLPCTMDDLPGLDAGLHRSLAHVTRYEGDVENDLCLDWCVREEAFGAVRAIELRPDGANLTVADHDRLGYAHAVADFWLRRRRVLADGAFARGLRHTIHPTWLKMFGVDELSRLMSGAGGGDGDDDTCGGVDVEDLRRHARYSGGYGAESRTVRMFWDVFESLPGAERRRLLKFVTSSSRPPVQGFRHLHPPFTIHKVRCEAPMGGTLAAVFGFAPDVDRLPSASTCFNTLKLPNYRRRATMREKVRYAIASGAGFELS